MSDYTKCMLPYIAVEGNIGAGKSTLLPLIAQQFNTLALPEPTQEWKNFKGINFLHTFYKDMPRWYYSFLTYVFLTYIKRHESYGSRVDAPFLFVERSLYTNEYVFGKVALQEKFISPLEWNLYLTTTHWVRDTYCALPHAIIYLRTTPEVCYKRIGKRGRIEEKNISLEYLNHLHEAHEQWLGEASSFPVPCLILDATKEFCSSPHAIRILKERIDQFVQNEIFNIPCRSAAPST